MFAGVLLAFGCAPNSRQQYFMARGLKAMPSAGDPSVRIAAFSPGITTAAAARRARLDLAARLAETPGPP